MNRRNVLVGLGGLVAGGGALIGTGAFDTVEAERTVSVETAGDAAALLAITAGPDYDDEVITDDDDVFVLDIGGAATGEGGQGVNRRALTEFSGLVQLTNQGTQDVDTITVDVTGDGSDILEIQEDFGSDTPLTPGDSTTFGISIDLTDDGPDAVTDEFDINETAFDPTLEITAQSN